MSQNSRYTECFQLDIKRKWEYLQQYYAAARQFYGYQDEVVSEAEIDAAVQSFKAKPRPQIRKSFSIKEWKYRHDADDAGLKEGFFSLQHDDADWETVQVPHSTRHVPEKPIKYGRDFYDFFLSGEESAVWYATTDNWYRSESPVGTIQENEIAYLRVESANLLSDLWVNANPVMIQHLGLFPFEIDVTEEAKDKKDALAQFAVRTRNIVTNKPWTFYNGFQLSYYNPPHTSGKLGEDWNDQPWTGIAGEVRLDVLNRVHIQDSFVITEALAPGRAVLNCQVNFRNTAWDRFHGSLRVEVSPWLPEEGAVIQAVASKVTILPMNHLRQEVRLTIDDPDLWSPEHPNLYLAHFVLVDESGAAIDDLYETFGVRTIRIIGNNYYLNNEKLYVRGTHDVCHFFEDSMICPSDRMIAKDILLHKKMGANCSRFPSDLRIHYKRIAEFCDQMGYMLSWAGFFEVWKSHPEMEMYARRDVGEMIRSLRNCPSIIIWEMGDEPLLVIKDYRRYQWYELVYELVKAEDETRPILPAGHFCGELVDLYEKRKDGLLSPEEIRRSILEDYPIYGLEKAYWDIHGTFMNVPLRPYREFMSAVKEAFGGERLTILTEFGLDALPQPDRAIDIYGKFRWGANPYWFRDRKDDDQAYYGKIITLEDWRETQAAQAIALHSAVVYLRENPEYFAGFYFMTMFDIWTYLQGVTDEKGRPKLGYFVARSLCQPVLLSGLHGSVAHTAGEAIEILASNLGQPVNGVSLRARLCDSVGQVLYEEVFSALDLEGSTRVSPAGIIPTNGYLPALYRLELLLQDASGAEIARALELFYLEA